jgi:hypothetical protein
MRVRSRRFAALDRILAPVGVQARMRQVCLMDQ